MKKRTKRKFKKIIKITLVILTIILLKNYITFIDNQTKKSQAVVEEFTTYAKMHNMSLTQDNYKTYLKNVNK